MTKDELIDKLKQCADEGPEEGHIKADALLIEWIDDDDIKAAYEAFSKWYA